MSTRILILCNDAAEREEIRALVATDIPLASGGTKPLPESIQWMPPGEHKITARGKDDKPITLTLTVGPDTAATIQAAFAEMKAEADRGDGDEPYFDFNHQDGEASAHPTEFYWAGNDPKTGGIRARLVWTDAGEAAVRGRRFRKFSPSFYTDKEGRVVGLPVNAGGLVNRPAFRRIAPISAKQAQPENQNQPTMKTLLAILAKLGLVQNAEADEASLVSQVSAAHAALVSERDKATNEVKARDESLSQAQKTIATMRKEHATAVVDAAIKAGRIPPQNEALKARWIAAIEADPKNADMLPEASSVVAGDTVVKAGAGGDNPPPNQAKEHAFIVKARAALKDHDNNLELAMAHVARVEPALYTEYRESLFGKR